MPNSCRYFIWTKIRTLAVLHYTQFPCPSLRSHCNFGIVQCQRYLHNVYSIRNNVLFTTCTVVPGITALEDCPGQHFHDQTIIVPCRSLTNEAKNKQTVKCYWTIFIQQQHEGVLYMLTSSAVFIVAFFLLF